MAQFQAIGGENVQMIQNGQVGSTQIPTSCPSSTAAAPRQANVMPAQTIAPQQQQATNVHQQQQQQQAQQQAQAMLSFLCIPPDKF